VARDHISVHIAQHADGDVNYNLLSLCRSPLCIIPEKLAENIKNVKAVEEVLSTQSPDWKLFLNANETITLDLEPNVSFGLTQDIIDKSSISEGAQKLNLECLSPPDLLNLRRQWIKDQTNQQIEFMEEAALIGQQDEQAERRKHDYTPVIYDSVKKLAEAGVLKDIVREVRATNA